MKDSFEIHGYPDIPFTIEPGCNPHMTVSLANSLRRVVESKPGLVTIDVLPPAFPCPTAAVKEAP